MANEKRDAQAQALDRAMQDDADTASTEELEAAYGILDGIEEGKPTVHALIVPWPLSEGLHTWCGYKWDHPRVADGSIASAPEAVTCSGCIRAMQIALSSLECWVPKLQPAMPHVEKGFSDD